MKRQIVLDVVIEIVLLFLALRINSLFAYLLFVICIIPGIAKRGLRNSTLWEVALFSIILPDNYSTLLLMILPSIAAISQGGVRRKLKIDKISVFMILIIVMAGFSSLLHSVPFVNIIFSLVFLSSVLLAVFVAGNGSLKRYLELFKPAFYRIIRIEIIATGINLILKILGRRIGDDWSTGTFGSAQQAQLFLFFSFVIIVLVSQYLHQKQKKRKDLLRIILCTLCMISTNSWAQLAITALFVFVAYITTVDRKIVKKILITTVVVVLAFIVVNNYVINSSIGQQIYRITYDQAYRNYRASKVNTYADTFYIIPQRDTLFLFMGNGLGWYSSRAALTCTGIYIGSYNSIFRPSMSSYTLQYIYPGLLRAYNNPSSDYGSVLARPYSSIITLMGETGIIGLTLFLIIFYLISKQYGTGARMILFAWLGSCFLENYLEYSKVVLMLLICIYWVSTFDSKGRVSSKPENEHSLKGRIE